MSYYYDLSTLDMSHPRVRCNGCALDKCALSGLIHEVAQRAGWAAWPLVSDIYWYSMTYAELRAELDYHYLGYCRKIVKD